MKYIRYAIIYALICSLPMHAMEIEETAITSIERYTPDQDDNASTPKESYTTSTITPIDRTPNAEHRSIPIIETRSIPTIISDIETKIIADGKKAFISDMEPVVGILNRYSNPQKSGFNKHMSLCVEALPSTPLYPAAIITHLSNTILDQATTKKLLARSRFNKKAMLALIEKHSTEETKNLEDNARNQVNAAIHQRGESTFATHIALMGHEELKHHDAARYEIERTIIEAGKSAFIADMASITDILNHRYSDYKEPGFNKMMKKCFTKMQHRPPYTADILTCLSKSLALIDPKKVETLKKESQFTKQFVLDLVETKLAEQTFSDEDWSALRVKKGAHYFAHAIARAGYNDAKETQSMLHASKLADAAPRILDQEARLADQQTAVLQARIIKSLEHAAYHAFNEAVLPIAPLVYQYLTPYYADKTQNLTPPRVYPHEIAAAIAESDDAALQKELAIPYIRKAVGKCAQSSKFTAQNLEALIWDTDPIEWIAYTTRAWYDEETKRRKAAAHANEYGLKNPPSSRFDNNHYVN